MDGVMRKLRWLICLCVAGYAWGQGVIVPVQQALGKVGAGMIPMSFATITVCAANSPGVPCSPVLGSTVFKDAALTQPLTNPFNADINGNYQFAVAAGQYTVTVTASGFNGYSYQQHIQPGLTTVPGQGQVLVGGPSGIISQSKAQIDVRDGFNHSGGVDCTGANDSTIALQSMINNAPDYSSFLIPQNCQIKVSGNPAVTINQRNGLQFIGQGRGANFCGTTQSLFTYNQTYVSGNTIFNINQSQQMLFQNFAVIPNGNADIVWNVDQTTSPPITTDNVWIDVCIRNNAPKNAAFRGWRFSNISSSNVENMQLVRPWVQCSSNGPGSATDSGVGIIFSASANQKGEVVDRPTFGGCSVGVSFGGGVGGGSALSMNNGLDSSSWINLQMGGFNDSLVGFRSENAHTGVVQETNSVGPHLIMHDDFAAIVTAPIDCPSGCGNTNLINNETDSSFGNWFNAHGTKQGVLFAVNNHNMQYDPYDWRQSVVFADGSTNLHGSGLGGMVLSAPLAITPNSSDCGVGSCASPPIFLDTQVLTGSIIDQFIIQAAPNQVVAGTTAGNTLMLVHNVGVPLTPWIAMQGQQSGAVYAQVPTPGNLSVTTRGTPGATTYTYQMVAHGATGTTLPSAAVSVTTGNATLSSTNLNFLQIPPAPGCTFYDVYRTACGGVGICSTNPTGKIGSLSCAAITNSNVSVTTGPEPFFQDTGLAGDASSPPATNTTGVIQAGVAIQATGTLATLAGTGACATRTTQSGGAWSGQVTCTGTTGASTLTITPGFTAPNGWFCASNDITHTLSGSQSTASTTAPVVSFTSVTANDVVNFSCTEY